MKRENKRERERKEGISNFDIRYCLLLIIVFCMFQKNPLMILVKINGFLDRYQFLKNKFYFFGKT
jgi:hypothetical protein